MNGIAWNLLNLTIAIQSFPLYLTCATRRRSGTQPAHWTLQELIHGPPSPHL
jgi:hypothetical protein